MELHDREFKRRRAHDMLALLRGPADQLPLHLRRVGRGNGDRRKREEGEGAGTDSGSHGRAKGEGNEAAGRGVEGDGSKRDEARRFIFQKP